MKLVVIGAGPSGLHFATTALERGHSVTMVDVGNTGTPPPAPKAHFTRLKETHADPITYFLGEDYDAASIPAADPKQESEYYGLPASKDHVFRHPSEFQLNRHGMSTLLSFASGGLAECWTGGAYPLTDDDLRAFGFGHDRLAPHYETVANRIGVGGLDDDLSGMYPYHGGLSEPIKLNTGNARLLEKYETRRAKLETKHAGVKLGRSRQAALSAPLGDRDGCSECGRCLWGCPTGAFYTPSLTLKTCLKHPNFEYLSGRFASHFTKGHGKSLGELVTLLKNGSSETVSGDAYILACGTISSSNIFLRTHYLNHGEIIRLKGLMDNQQVLAPFFNASMFGRAYDPQSYQYHQLAIGMETEDPSEFVHAQVTSMTTASAHPIMAQIPLGMSAARKVFTTIRSSLGVVNLNFNDTRRDTNYLTLDSESDQDWPGLVLRYQSPEGQSAQIASAMSRLSKFMRDLGAPLVLGMAQVRTPGASVHYSGTLPISVNGDEFTVNETCQSNDYHNLFVVDGSVFPALPAKNLTFTLMANATRVATEAF